MHSHVLVVGGAGYIGSHTCKQLRAAGYVPVVLDDFSMGHEWAVKFGPLEQGDAGSYDFVREVIRKHNIQAVLHFAANAYVGESVENPRKYFANNVTAMDQLLRACLDEGVKSIIFSSSCATYGAPIYVPVDEAHPQHPMSPYGDSKLIGEKMLHWYSGAYDLKYVALRYFNACGADPEGEIGEVHEPETHLIPIVLQAVQGKRKAIQVFGTDYDTPDGTCIRDYIHVTDLADAHVKALQYLENGGESIQINLGTGTGYSVREIIESAERVTGKPVPVEYGPRRAGDPPALWANPAKAKAVLGWEPKLSDIDTVLGTAWAWENARLEKGL